jgi:type IV secretory pathway TraG/TraD family ATPase VirD4
MSDLSAVSPDFAKAINTNTNIKCILGINDPDTADFYAKHLGTQTTRKLTEQVEESGFFSRMEEVGRGSSREVEEYRVHPNDLKELFNGRGVLHIPTAKGPITEIIQFNRIKV